MTSPHLSKARLVVMIVDLVSALSERWLKSSCLPPTKQGEDRYRREEIGG